MSDKNFVSDVLKNSSVFYEKKLFQCFFVTKKTNFCVSKD